MANLNETPGWDSITQIELTDRVLGGAGGTANRQAQQLANRTALLAGPGGADKVGFQPAGAGAVVRSVQGKMRESVSVLDYIPVSEHAAILAGTSTLDCTAFIQAALNTAGAVYVPPGVVLSGPVSIPPRVRLFGAGNKSIIKHRGGAGNLLSFLTGSDASVISDLFLDCSQQTSGDGIVINPGTSPLSLSLEYNDSHNTVENVFVYYPAQNGVNIESGREIRLLNVCVRDPQAGHGFRINGSDNFIFACTAATTGGGYHGFFISGSNNKLVGCKAFYCGEASTLSDGFFVQFGRNQLVGCEAQENARYGFHFAISSSDSVGSGLLADSNGVAGIHINNSDYNLRGLCLVGFTSTTSAGLRFTQQHGISFDTAYPSTSQIVGTCINNAIGGVLAPSDAEQLNSTIIISAAGSAAPVQLGGNMFSFNGGRLASIQGEYDSVSTVSGLDVVHRDDSDNVAPSAIDIRAGFRSAIGALAKWAGFRSSRDSDFANDIGLTVMVCRAGTSIEAAKFTKDRAFEIRNVDAAPTVNPVGGVLYVEAGVLKYRGQSGTVSTVAPA
jgi:hypothetical protein